MRKLVVEGILAIQAGDNPRVVVRKADSSCRRRAESAEEAAKPNLAPTPVEAEAGS